MSVLARLLIVGGGLALGLIAAGSAAKADKERMMARTRGYRGVNRRFVRPVSRRTSRPRGTYVG